MSRFYGTLQGDRPGESTRGSQKRLHATAASYAGAVQVNIYLESDGTERWAAMLEPWQGEGPRQAIAYGVLGQRLPCSLDEALGHVRTLAATLQKAANALRHEARVSAPHLGAQNPDLICPAGEAEATLADLPPGLIVDVEV